MNVDLEEMARQLAGDDGLPNLFFVTDCQGRVLALATTTEDEAIEVALRLEGADTVEDRQTGLVWQDARLEAIALRQEAQAERERRPPPAGLEGQSLVDAGNRADERNVPCSEGKAPAATLQGQRELLGAIRAIIDCANQRETALAALEAWADVRDLLYPESEAARSRAVEKAQRDRGEPWRGV